MKRFFLAISALLLSGLFHLPAQAACCDWNAGVHGDLIGFVGVVDDENKTSSATSLQTMDFGSNSTIWRQTPEPRLGIANHIFQSNISVPRPKPVQGALNAPAHTADASQDDLKLNYFTPRFNGFQAAISFTPEHVKTTQDYQSRFNLRPGQLQKIVVLSGNYEKQLGGVELGLSAAYGQGDLEAVRFSGQRDPRSYGVGASVGLQGFTLAGSYSQANNFSSRGNLPASNFAEKNWDVALSYETGPWKFAGGVGLANRETPGGLNKLGTHKSAEGGVNYNLGSGISLGVMGVYFNYEAADSLGKVVDNNAGAAAIFETGVEF